MIEDIPVPIPQKPKRFLDQVREFIRLEGKSYATEVTYLQWIKRYILFHNKQHPKDLGGQHIEQYLNYLCVQCNVSKSTQATALNAIMYLYNKFLKKNIDKIKFKPAVKKVRIPSVFSHDEAMDVIETLNAPYSLLAKLMYGSGLRISEAVRLRVKDIDFKMNYICVRDGKGNKDRTTLLPKTAVNELKKQISIVEKLLLLDKEKGIGPVYMPNQLEKKYPSAGRSIAWQYVFPSEKTSLDPRANVERRHHIYRATVQKNVKHAINRCNINKQVSCHSFRHAFATRLLENKYDLRQIQKLMGHADISTTEVYLHVVEQLGTVVASPID